MIISGEEGNKSREAFKPIKNRGETVTYLDVLPLLGQTSQHYALSRLMTIPRNLTVIILWLPMFIFFFLALFCS